MQTKSELYQNAASLAGLGIWERNFLEGTFYWNKIIFQIMEVDDDYMGSMEDVILFYREPAKVRALIDKAIVSGLPERGELEVLTAKNTQKWVEVRVQAESADDRCTRLYGTLTDITDRRLQAMALEEREQRFSKAFDHAPIGMALVSLNGGWIKVNTSLCQLFGYTEPEFLGHTFQEFTYPADLESDLEQLNLLVAGDIGSYTMEKRYYHADGRIIWALLSVSLVRSESGAPLYFVSQIKDVTDQKNSMEIIRLQNDRLLNFAHIVSHNLRSHSGNIRMLTSMILEETDPAEKETLVQMLDGNAASLLETLAHLNEVVKVQESSADTRVRIDLAHEVERGLNILSASIRASNASIIKDMDDGITVVFNPAYLESVLVNLIGNSLKYQHPERRPEIKISANLDDGVPLLIIADNGLGIDLALHGHKLFGMYKTFHRHPDARGMGLFLVKNQVEAMGGRIWAESQPGVGTSFFIQFTPLIHEKN